MTAKKIAKLFVWKTETYELDLRGCESMIIEYAKSKCKQQREIIAKKIATDFDDSYLSELCIESIEPKFD